LKGKDEKKSKSQAKSKYTEKAECLFRTKVPPNRSSLDAADEKQDKQSKKEKKKTKPAQETVVHEFSKTISHPSFLRTADESKPLTSEFVEGKGWVDSSGNAKEPVSEKIRKDRFMPGKTEGALEKPMKKASVESKTKTKVSKVTEATPVDAEESEDWTSSSGSSTSEDESSDSESEDDEEGGSLDESSSASSKDEEVQEQPQSIMADSSIPAVAEHPLSEESAGIQSPDEENRDKVPTEVHPLEALFKRPLSQPAAAKVHVEPSKPVQFLWKWRV